MPLQFDDAAQHAANLPSLGDRIAAVLSAIKSRLADVDGNDKRLALSKDLDDHHDLLVRTMVGDLGHGARGPYSRLGPGETPVLAGDRVMTAAQANKQGNPTLPVDASGNKVHPADAYDMAASNPAQGQGFGGNGMFAGAGTAQRIPADVLEPNRDDRALVSGQAQPRTGAIPVIHAEVVEGSERTAPDGKRYVSKRWPDGSVHEVRDLRPDNGPR